MIKHTFHLILFLLAGAFFLSAGTGQKAFAQTDDKSKEDKIVIIVNTKSKFPKEVPAEDIQDIYLGNKQFDQGIKILALNQTDKDILTAFLERFLTMTAPSYRNRAVKKLLAEGWTPPKDVVDPAKVIKMVSEDVTAIGYVWSSDLPEDLEDIRIVASQ